ncbi:hypothetical protein HWV62_22335 [Athelia sp. TMB]|nr:hypothetical protein HWV62_27293 [Athelia sp. TMB]KAF7983357.1 hypothetical protein HWV62_22335 [Athelia sp. TMB]
MFLTSLKSSGALPTTAKTIPALKPLLLLSLDEQRALEEETPNIWLNPFTAPASEAAGVALMLRAFNSVQEWRALRRGSIVKVERDIGWDMYSGSFKLVDAAGPVQHTPPSEMFAELEEIRHARHHFALWAAKAAATAKFVEAEQEQSITLSSDSGRSLFALLDAITDTDAPPGSNFLTLAAPSPKLSRMDYNDESRGVCPGIQSDNMGASSPGAVYTFAKAADGKVSTFNHYSEHISAAVTASSLLLPVTWNTSQSSLQVMKASATPPPPTSPTRSIEGAPSSPLSILRFQAAMRCQMRRSNKLTRKPFASIVNVRNSNQGSDGHRPAGSSLDLLL